VSGLKERFMGILRLLRRTRIYVVSFLVLLLAAIFVGLDNPTGIILGWLAVTVLGVAMVRKWRKPGYFFILLVGTVLGAILLSGIYVEVAHPLAKWIGGANVSESIGWRVFHVIISNVILLCTPVGVFIGLTGFIIMIIWKIYDWRQRRRTSNST
jgi:hypothetical protein